MKRFKIAILLTMVIGTSLACNASAPALLVAPATPSPTPQLVGQSRDNPFPLGYEACSVNQEGVCSDMTLRVVAVSRSDVIGVDTPLWVTVTAGCVGSKSCSINPYDFQLVGSTGLVREILQPSWLIEGMLYYTEFYSDATVTGGVLFAVAEGESDFVLMYSPSSRYTAFFALE